MARVRPAYPNCHLLGVRVDILRWDSLMSLVDWHISTQDQISLSYANAHTLNLAYEDHNIRQLLNNESEDAIGRERQILPKTSPVDDDLHQSSCEYPDIAFEHAGSKDDYTYVVNRDNSRSTH